MTHTPGPWHRNIKPARKYSTVFAGRNTHVVRVVSEGLNDDEIEANCDLVVAAPEMLDTLRMLLTHTQECRRHDCPPDNYAIAAIRAAIAKAEGRA